MAEQIRYEFGSIDETGAMLMQAAAQCKAAVAELGTKMKNTCGEDWQGGASEMYATAQTQCNTKLDEFADKERQSGCVTQQAGADMLGIDNRCAGLFG
ncbi:hypothetical protein [Prauserella cavernicola]|uniref:WXG100 family type VII secretion target n=1 Tax=Prauserella cavernicola TaxID=2800127 RepID=A0A934QNI2_9PSEU|nr:hypothetical protein [Prauserella cavernicola]MBK1783465.1 hypothetical protein [Prauserella cavernicola]